MELDDLKITWQNEGNISSQNNLTTLIIDKMTQHIWIAVSAVWIFGVCQHDRIRDRALVDQRRKQ